MTPGYATALADFDQPAGCPATAAAIGALATRCLLVELDTWPKPGLVSPHDNGSHDDMDAGLLDRSARALQPYFAELAAAGTAEFATLRAIGLAAEAAMLAETRGVNTHRGAVFGLGLLCAAAGARHLAGIDTGRRLGAIVHRRWSAGIAGAPAPGHSHGGAAARRYGVGGARAEAVAGFPTAYDTGLPALRAARDKGRGEEAARVEAVFALIARLDDTNLLHRGERDGLAFAQGSAARFLRAGGVGAPGWRNRAAQVHAAFVARRLSPGGAADLLAMSLFLDALEEA